MSVVAAGHIDLFSQEDVQQVAALHLSAFPASSASDLPRLERYYRETFFLHPWRDDEITSLVYRDPAEGITGFLGCIPRNMWFNDRPIRVAVTHRLMARPGRGGAMVGIRLVESLLAGKQDLTVGDGATDAGKSLLSFGGAQVATLYCMNWVKPIRPLAFMASLTRKLGVPPWGARLLAPITWVGDSLLSRSRGMAGKAANTGVIPSAISAESLLEVIQVCSRRFKLRPQYAVHEIEWLLARLRENFTRGDLRGSIVRRAGQVIGGYIWYLDDYSRGEVVFLASKRGSETLMFEHLLRSADDDGAVALFGRFDPSFVESYWNSNCFVKRGDWAMVHARDSSIATTLMLGDAFLTALEGELWLAGPNSTRQ